MRRSPPFLSPTTTEETMIMFHHFEYIGDDFTADMKKLDDDPTIKFWWTQ